MKAIIKLLFYIYHLVFQSNNRTCRYTPTCSQYWLDAVNKYGAFRGTYLAIKRIGSCHPLSTKPYYDPA